MQWVMSTRRLAPIKNLSISKAIKKETNEDRDGGNPSNVLGFEPQSITCEYMPDRIVGGAPLQEYETWKRLVGEKAPFYLGGQRLGPPRVQLKEVGLSETELDGNGEISRATISLSFVQDGGDDSMAGNVSDVSGIGSGRLTTALKVGPSQSVIKQKIGR